jgi:fermentation-respiration switch protein FrsA (DUF1100 family)
VAKKQIFQTVRDRRALPHGERVQLEIRAEDGAPVPAILLRPAADARVPGALLLHGYGSRKERLSDTIGVALLERGIASMAIDLPFHGEREGEPYDLLAIRSPLALMRQWQAALDESALALRYLSAHPAVDRARLSLLGYSLGSFMGVTVAAREPLVSALVIAAGGDLPEGTPFARLIRAVVNPLTAVQKLNGRPLLMVHGRWDRTVMPEQAERLFAAAREPKEMRWWDAGHLLPPAAIAATAEWLADRMRGERQQRSG